MNTLALYRVKNEARWIAESIHRTLQVADHVIVFDDHSNDGTTDHIERFRVDVIKSPFEGLDEARDKNFLFKEALKQNPAWILFLDGDEVLTASATKEVYNIARYSPGAIFFFRMAYLWDNPRQERIDGVYARLMAPRMFSLLDQPNLSRLEYGATSHGGNLHCGQIPKNYTIRSIQHASSPIKHYGYMFEEDRKRKHTWYNEVDSNEGKKMEGNYDHIIGLPNKHAPGDIRLVPFNDI